MALVAERDGASDASQSEKARRAMIDSQLRVSGVNDEAILAAMASVPREHFVPEVSRTLAYIDRAIALGDGRFLAAPLVQGRMLTEAAPTRDDSVLVVDGGSGYLAALVREMAGPVEVIDAQTAAGKPGKQGAFTLLMIDGAVEQIPDALAKRLADGARVVTGLVERGVTRLAKGRKVADTISLMPLAEIGIPVLPEFAAPKGWKF